MITRLLNVSIIFALSSCATTPENSPIRFDELPKSPATAALDPAYVLPEKAKKASVTEYKQALVRSSGFVFNIRAMLMTEPLLKLSLEKEPREKLISMIKENVTDKTCFRFEYDTYDKEAVQPSNWDLSLINAKTETLPLAMTVDEASIKDAVKSRSLQIRATLCTTQPIEVLEGFKMSLTPKYDKKPEAVIFEWTKWKPGVSQAPTRVSW